MTDSKNTTTALVPCRDANGVPTLFVATLHVTEKELKAGHHYPVARRLAEENGYVTRYNAPVIDREDARLHSEEMEALFDLATDGKARKALSLLAAARDKLNVANELVDPVEEDGEWRPFVGDLVEEIDGFLESVKGRS